MIAIRAIIKDKKRKYINTDLDYKLLYRIGVVDSMCVLYSSLLKQPGFNILERIPGAMLFNLRIPYEKIGFEKVKLFNTTDCKAFIELWGIPETHQTMNTFYSSIWNKYETALKDECDNGEYKVHLNYTVSS